MKKFGDKLNRLIPKVLRIPPPVLYGQPGGEVLLSRNVSLIDITPRIKGELLSMINVTEQFQLPTLAANQLNFPFRAITITNKDVMLMINPEILEVSNFNRMWEYSLSFPFMRAKMGRFESITITYQDQYFNDIQERFDGVAALRIQQSLDQLNGFTLLDCRISQGDWEILKVKQDMLKTQKALEFYSKDVKKLLQTHPQYFESRSVQQLNKLSRDDIEEFSFEDLMLRRLFRYVQREFTEQQGTQEQEALYEQLKNQK